MLKSVCMLSELPKIISANETVSVFGSHTLTCEATGDPSPEIYWILPNETSVSVIQT